MHRRSAITSMSVLAVAVVAAAGCATTTTKTSTPASPTTSTAGASPTTTPATTAPTTVAPTTTTTIPARAVTGSLVTLGAGTFTVGSDIQPGLYNVTAAAGQSGNFIVSGTDMYDEILGGDPTDGDVPEIRAQLSTGDSVQLSSLSAVTFTPVTTPYVTTVQTVDLYAGTWVVGKDIAPGTYVATPAPGESGNFIVSGNDDVDEILGGSVADGAVPNVTTQLSKGDIIDVSSLSQVVMTPKS
jgi:hypothetical protein